MAQSEEENAYFFRHQIPGVIASDAKLGVPGDEDGDEGEEGITGPTGCDNFGDTCDDGTIYAGVSPHGGVKMYTTGHDEPGRYQWKTSNTLTPGVAGDTDGLANTDAMEAAGLSDHPAAEACRSRGSEWYLPAVDELSVLYTNKNTGDLNGTFDDEVGSFPAGYYWSSSEINSFVARAQSFRASYASHNTKVTELTVRCVRK